MLSAILIIGMAKNGISIKDHETYKKVCKEYNNVKVYYKKDDPSNHMKVYQWYRNGKAELSFVGSANFSKTGFFVNDEILATNLNVFSNLIDDIILESIFCLDENVDNFIPFYKDINEHLQEMINVSNFESNIENFNRDKNIQSKNKINLKKLLLTNFVSNEFSKASVELVLKNDPHYASRGLNNWNRKYNNEKDSYIDIERTNKIGLNKNDFFPRDSKIKLISDDHVEWTVRRTGDYGKKLIVTNGINFYEYFRKRLELEKGTKISYAHLLDYGRTDIDLYKISESEYLLNFSLDK